MSIRIKGRWLRRILITLAAEPGLTLRQLTIRCGVHSPFDEAPFCGIVNAMLHGQHIMRDDVTRTYALSAPMQQAAIREYRWLFHGETV